MSRTLSLITAFFLGSVASFARVNSEPPAIGSQSALPGGTVGLPYHLPSSSPNPNVKFSTDILTPLPKNLVWSATGVPPGLILNRQGVLSGKPKKDGNFTITVFLKSGRTTVDSGTFEINIVNTANPVISGDFILPAGQFDKPYQGGKANNGYKLSAIGGYPFSLTQSKYISGYHWQLIPGKTPDTRLPKGMTMNANGVISGTPVWPKCPVPDATKEYKLKVRATDFLGKSSVADFILPIAPPLAPEIISDCPLPDGTELAAYPLVQLKASGGKQYYTWSIIEGEFPPGLKFSPKGYISGTPAKDSRHPYTYKFKLKVTDRNCLADEKNCEMTIYPTLTCNQTINLPCLYQGMVLANTTIFSASGGKPPYNWSILPVRGSVKTLPASLAQVSGDSSAIAGIITEFGTFSFIGKVTDALGNSCSASHSIVVYPKLEDTTGCPLPSGTVGSSYSGNLTARGGKPPYTWEIVEPTSLPLGLSVNATTGRIEGSPTEAGNYTFTYTLTDSCSQNITKNCTIEIKEFTNLCSGRVTVIQICNENSAKDDNFDIYLNNEKIGDVDLSYNDQVGSLFVAHPTATITSGDFKCPIDKMVIHRFSEKLVKLGANSLNMLNTKNNNNGNYGIIEIRSYKFDGTFLSDPRVISDVTYSGSSGANITPPDFSYSCPEDTVPSSLAFAEVFSSANVLVDNEKYKMVAVSFNPSAQPANPAGLKSNPLLNAANFKINRFETTNKCYTDFLNAIAKTDYNNLYSPQMSKIGIQKNSNYGTITYSIDSGFENYPVSYVSWFDAARYANWLANGKPTGSQSPTTTENGAYNLASSSSIVRNSINPNTGAPPTFWLLNESEWYTSSYIKNDGSALWDYPTQSNTAPDSTGANPSNFANFGGVFGETTPVGFFNQSPGPFGTFDQAGNVREWTESLDTSSGTTMRIIRGGSWADPVDAMRADESHIADPTLEDDKTGFRIGGAP